MTRGSARPLPTRTSKEADPEKVPLNGGQNKHKHDDPTPKIRQYPQTKAQTCRLCENSGRQHPLALGCVTSKVTGVLGMPVS